MRFTGRADSKEWSVGAAMTKTFSKHPMETRNEERVVKHQNRPLYIRTDPFTLLYEPVYISEHMHGFGDDRIPISINAWKILGGSVAIQAARTLDFDSV